MPRNLLAAATAALSLTLAPRPLLAWASGPPPDRVNLCIARLSCNDILCHDSFLPNSGSALSELKLATGPLPRAYKPGELVAFVLSVVDPDPSRLRYGYQIGSITGCPFPVQAGAWSVAEPGRSQLVTAASGLQFSEHLCNGPGDPATCGYLPAVAPGTNEWRLDWQAPAQDQGPITFYWAVNSADGNALPTNDFISLWLATLDPNCPRRITTLAAAKGACAVVLSWDAVPYANGYRVYRTTDPLDLGSPGSSGALEVGACDDPPAGPALYFYTVVGTCADSSDGPS